MHANSDVYKHETGPTIRLRSGGGGGVVLPGNMGKRMQINELKGKQSDLYANQVDVAK